MTAPDRECPEAWLARRLAAGRPAETWKAMPRIDGCPFSGYEAADTGIARTVPGGEPVKMRPHKDGYLLADFRCDDPGKCRRHGRHTFTMHKVVLTTFDKPRPPGMQGSHLYGNPVHNWFPEGLAWEDQPANERRKTSRPAPPDPTHPCRNAPACPNLVIHPGRRCLDCVTEFGRQAGAMLQAGQPLPVVAMQLQSSEDWAYKKAVEHGGYKGTAAEARLQRPPLTGWRAKVARLVGAA